MPLHIGGGHCCHRSGALRKAKSSAWRPIFRSRRMCFFAFANRELDGVDTFRMGTLETEKK